ncbi:hypothetical protein [Aquabacterium sp.]|uniref:hypothetical protein n=1 Tax=Aquabacterium sp. TaxID=1872578 RepID=UPI002E375E41|nr:hypothetical protein [Aquabacterium sp.]HEX5312287.1 hypothetical protein [Aquabacterium sp.]
MNFTKSIVAALLAFSISGCATYKPIPDGYTGPTASVADTGQSEDFSSAAIFAITEIDGKSIPDSFGASRAASRNRGAELRLTLIDRQVPAKKMKVKIRGSHITGAPLYEIVNRAVGMFFEVEGVVDFTPEPNGKYAVVGTLSKGHSIVWIEDAVTNKPVTEKISSK